MLTKTLSAIGLVACLALTPATSPASASPASGPPTEKLVLELVTASGSGCQSGTVAVAVNPDNMKLMLSYSNYFAQVGVGAAPTDFRKNCQLNLILHHPREYTYAITEARLLGFTVLQAGAYATVKSNYYFRGHSQTAPMSHQIDGPRDDDWSFDDRPQVEMLDWEPCGEQRNLNINTELRVFAGASDPKTTTSFIAMDSLDLAGGTRYSLAWQRCPES